MAYYRYYKLEKYVNGVAQGEYKQGARVNDETYETYNDCMVSPVIKYRWASTSTSLCDGVDLYYLEKQQISYDDGFTWTDTGVTRTPDTPSERNSYQCGYRTRWNTIFDDTIYMCNEETKDKHYTDKFEISTDYGETWTDTGDRRMAGSIIEEKSVDCGALYNWFDGTNPDEYRCDTETYTKYNVQYEKVSIDDGETWENTGNKRMGSTPLETESADCGYTVGIMLDGFVNLSNYQVTPVSTGTSFSHKPNMYPLSEGEYLTYKTTGTNTVNLGIFDICSGNMTDNLIEDLSSASGSTDIGIRAYYDGTTLYVINTDGSIKRQSDGNTISDNFITGIIDDTHAFNATDLEINFYDLDWSNETSTLTDTITLGEYYSGSGTYKIIESLFYQPDTKKIGGVLADTNSSSTYYWVFLINGLTHQLIKNKKYNSGNIGVNPGSHVVSRHIYPEIYHQDYNFELHHYNGTKIGVNFDNRTYSSNLEYYMYQYNLDALINPTSININLIHALLPCITIEERWITVEGEYVCIGDDKYNVEKQQYSRNGGPWTDTGTTRTGSTVISADDPVCVAQGIWRSNYHSSVPTPTSNTGFTIVDYGLDNPDDIEEKRKFKVKDSGTALSFEASSSTSSSKVLHADFVDLTNMTSLARMFYKNRDLETVDVSGWNTYNITNFNEIFYETRKLTTIDLSSWDLSNAESIVGWLTPYETYVKQSVSIPAVCASTRLYNINNIFDGATWLNNTEFAKLLNWNLSNVTSASYAFRKAGMSGDISGKLNFSSLTDVSNMFASCTGITKADITGWFDENASISFHENMFNGCTGLTEVTMKGIDFSNSSGLGGFFRNCSNLVTVDISGSTLPSAYSYFFTGCSSLTTINATNCDADTISRLETMVSNAGLTSQVTIIS